MPARRLAPAPRGPPASSPGPFIHRTRHISASGLTQKDIMLNHIRVSKFAVSNPRNGGRPKIVLFQFPTPPKDASYSNISIVFNKSRNGLVPKDERLNHVQPLLVA